MPCATGRSSCPSAPRVPLSDAGSSRTIRRRRGDRWRLANTRPRRPRAHPRVGRPARAHLRLGARARGLGGQLDARRSRAGRAGKDDRRGPRRFRAHPQGDEERVAAREPTAPGRRDRARRDGNDRAGGQLDGRDSRCSRRGSNPAPWRGSSPPRRSGHPCGTLCPPPSSPERSWPIAHRAPGLG